MDEKNFVLGRNKCAPETLRPPSALLRTEASGIGSPPVAGGGGEPVVIWSKRDMYGFGSRKRDATEKILQLPYSPARVRPLCLGEGRMRHTQSAK